MAFGNGRKPVDNGAGSMLAYNRRQEYRMDALESYENTGKFIDMWYSNTLYGKMDNAGNTVVPLQETGLAQLPGASPFFAVDFVVDAFKDMRDHILSAIGKNNISLPIGPISEIAATRAWIDPNAAYESHLENVKNSFIASYMSPNSEEIYDILDMIPLFERFIQEHVLTYPITFSGFMMSEFCPPQSTGLIIELSSENHGDDKIKTEIIDSSEFRKYVSIANRYGFYVNKNAPWALIANLVSPKMQYYMSRKGLRRAQDYFSEYCWPTYLMDLQKIKDLFYDIYYTFITENPTIKKVTVCENNEVLKKKIMTRKLLTLKENSAKITDKYWFRLYIIMRAYEQRTSIKPIEGARLLEKAVYLGRKEGNINSAVRNINRFFKRKNRRISPLPLIDLLKGASDMEIERISNAMFMSLERASVVSVPAGTQMNGGDIVLSDD